MAYFEPDWNDPLRREVEASWRQAVQEADALLARIRLMVSDPPTADLAWVLREYARGVGSQTDVTLFRLREFCDDLGRAVRFIGPAESFFDSDWMIRTEVAGAACPGIEKSFPFFLRNEDAKATKLLEACPNEIYCPGWPPALAGYSRLPRRFPLLAYSSHNATVYAHPFQYQIMSRDLRSCWISGSPRGLSKEFLWQVESLEVDEDVVVIQDRFDFRNLCHFLYDGATRILHYCEAFGPENKIFVLGGVPGKYHDLVCEALAETTGVPRSRFFFPARGTLILSSGSATWFSDQMELHAHPAQMAHPRSLSALHGLMRKIPAIPSEARRIYISRADAAHRRISNEREIRNVLERRGFVSVRLADLDPAAQIGLFRRAEVVVGPHGMGLTHIVAGEVLGQVIELFHPEAGTDAYGSVARSAGIEYDNILGTPTPGGEVDFEVDPERVARLVDASGHSRQVANWDRSGNLIPAASTFAGFIEGAATAVAMCPGTPPRLVASQAVMRHRKADPPGNTATGEWNCIDTIPDRIYTASCWVWVPAAFQGASVSVRVADWPPTSIGMADLSRREEWQRISYTTRSPAAAGDCPVTLHIEGASGDEVFSTCWQFERSPFPSGYQPTG
jgi:Glycosyltransferase 61